METVKIILDGQPVTAFREGEFGYKVKVSQLGFGRPPISMEVGGITDMDHMVMDESVAGLAEKVAEISDRDYHNGWMVATYHLKDEEDLLTAIIILGNDN